MTEAKFQISGKTNDGTIYLARGDDAGAVISDFATVRDLVRQEMDLDETGKAADAMTRPTPDRSSGYDGSTFVPVDNPTPRTSTADPSWPDVRDSQPAGSGAGQWDIKWRGKVSRDGKSKWALAENGRGEKFWGDESLSNGSFKPVKPADD